MQNFIITLVFDKNAIFCRKLSKVAENCDHNIDSRDRCYDFKNTFAAKFGEKMAFLLKNAVFPKFGL
jgi:hypothetical protein